MKRASAEERLAAIREIVEQVVVESAHGLVVLRELTFHDIREVYRLSAPARKGRKR